MDKKFRQHANTLYTGDNLHIMHGMNSESVDLIYLDPPFNSKRLYSAPVGSKAAGASFKDMWTWEDIDEAYLESLTNNPALVRYIDAVDMIHGKATKSYLTFMAQRIIEMHRILKPTGSLYLHCDPTMSHYLKVVLDAVFGKAFFCNEIAWCYQGRELSKTKYNKKHDVILFYSKSRKFIFNWEAIGDPLAETSRKAMSRHIDESGRAFVLRYKKGGGFAPISKDQSSETYRQLVPEKIPPKDWVIIDYSRKSERTGYPTQKPLALLHRIIEASSNEGDIVLDPFCGCATTCVAAQQLQRKWIGIDIETKAADIVIQRLSDDAGLFKDMIHRNDLPQRTDVQIQKTDVKSVKYTLNKQQKGVCNGCQDKLDIRHFEVDHVIPKSRGGGDYIENYQLLCGNCNRIKGNKPMEYLRLKISKLEAHLRTRVTFGD